MREKKSKVAYDVWNLSVWPCMDQLDPARPRGTCVGFPPPGRCGRRCLLRRRCEGWRSPSPSPTLGGTRCPPEGRMSRSCEWCRYLWQWSHVLQDTRGSAESSATPPSQSAQTNRDNLEWEKRKTIIHEIKKFNRVFLCKSYMIFAWYKCNHLKKLRQLSTQILIWALKGENMYDNSTRQSEQQRPLKSKAWITCLKRTEWHSSDRIMCVFSMTVFIYASVTDLISSRESVHLHQLTLCIQNQLSEGEQLRGRGAFR